MGCAISALKGIRFRDEIDINKLLMNWSNQEAVRYLVSEIEKAEEQGKKPMQQPFELYQRLAGICVDGFVNDTRHKWEYKHYSEMVKSKCLAMVMKANKMTNSWRGLYWELLRAETYEFFESFIYFMEMKRPFDKKFYEPRQKTLKVVVDDLQDLEDGKYRFYGLSMPSRVGKSTICIFFLAWIAMRKPNSHSAMGGHSGVLAKGFYKELMNLIATEEYTFGDLYEYWHSGHPLLTDKSADEFTITLDMPDRFATITCRGIDGTWTGAIDVSSDGYLYVDDLVRDRTHALSPTRMEDTFAEYLNKMVDRLNTGAKQLMVGTLWNVLDPLMRLEEMYGTEPGYLFRKIPALDENDESNFNYAIKGFTTEYYRDMRDMLVKAGNEAEWMAKFQQRPYNREGLLFPLNELGYFNGIISGDHPCEFVTVCDVAFGGGDNVSMPVGIKDLETDTVYVVDWYYNSAGVKVTVPGVCDMIIKHGIRSVTFERNNGGLLYAKQVNEELQKRKYLCACETKPAPNNISKSDKIKSCEGKIKEKVKFLDGTDCQIELEDGMAYYPKTAQYDLALRDMSTFVTIGKNISDDAADSIAQLCLKAYGDINSMATVETISRAMLGF